MNARLLFKNKSIENIEPDAHTGSDLELNSIIDAMAGSDRLIRETASCVFSRENNCHNVEEIIYRQDILSDCLAQEAEIRRLYQLLARSAGKNKDTFLSVTHTKAKYMLDVAVKVMLSMQEPLSDLYQSADKLLPLCGSAGFTTLFAGLKLLFEPEKLAGMIQLISQLQTRNGISAAACPGKRLRAEKYHPWISETGTAKRKSLFGFLKNNKNQVSFDVDMNDPEASPALGNLKNDLVLESASIVVQARDELFDFLEELLKELSFYIGCLNLKDSLDTIGIPVCRPVISSENVFLSCRQLYNISLSLMGQKPAVPNSVSSKEEKMIIITGSNQGGKTTFLRGLGQSLLMMASGMFVAAEEFEATFGRIFTHFIREEDKSLKSGKLDEELVRMSEIVDRVRPGDWLLLNESFASTNEEEGSEIAMEIITALYDKGIHVVYVTHFYHLTQLLEGKRAGRSMYLNASRDEKGTRTYRMLPGPPQVRGYGEDLYHEIFGF